MANLLIRALLLLYPASWRIDYAAEVRSVLNRRRKESSAPWSAVLLWIDVIPDLLWNALAAQWDVLRQDLHQSIRTLSKSPAFALTATAIAALGIGATTAAFTMVNHVFLHPLPYAHQDRLVQMREDDLAGMGRYWDTSPANYRDWKNRSNSFEELGAFRALSVNVSGDGAEPARIEGAALTGEVFSVLGIDAALGRTFHPADDREASPATVVLSYGLWQDRFGGNPNVIGKTINLDNLPQTIIGVMPKDFYFPDREARLWTAMRWPADAFSDRRDTYIFPVGLLKQGVSPEQAQSEMRTIASRLAHAYPKELLDVGITVAAFRDLMPNRARLMLRVLLASSLCLLLIACMNLANLLLARAMVRRRELAVRFALGAGRERLVRQVLTESLLLAIPGGLFGLLLAHLSLPLLVRLVPVALPISEMPTLDPAVVFFALAVTFLTGIGFGVIPALRSGSGSATDLHSAGRSGMGHRREQLRGSLVVLEIACSMVLLIGFGLLARALWQLQSVNPGFQADHVLTLRTQLPMPRYAKPETREPFYRHVLDETKRIPGVKGAAYTSFLPMAFGGGIWPVAIEGRPEDLAHQRTASLRFVTPGFFATLHVPFISGRDFSPFDLHNAPYVAIVSQSFVKRYWSSASPLGRRIQIGNQSRLVVGVVADVLNRGLERIAEPQVYVAWQQGDGVSSWYAPKDLVVRTAGDPAAIIPALRRIIHQADPVQPVSDVQTMSDVVQAETASRRVELAALGVFGALAIVLAAVGIHALLSFAVSTRTQEIGVRMALGARPASVVRMTLAEGFTLASIGIGIGLILSFAVGRFLESMLAGVKPWDQPVLATAVAVSLLMTLLGASLPALRAARIDPMSAMRSE